MKQVHRFGLQLSKEQEELKDCILPQLDVQRAGLRKRAIACVGAYCPPHTITLTSNILQR